MFLKILDIICAEHLSASLGIEQFLKIRKFNRIRIKNAKYLYSKLKLNFDDYFEFPSMIFNKSNTFILSQYF